MLRAVVRPPEDPSTLQVMTGCAPVWRSGSKALCRVGRINEGLAVARLH